MAEATVEYKAANNDVEAGPIKFKSHSKDDGRTSSLTEQPVRRPSKIPILFERSARSWWNPKFDSDILEVEFQKRSFVQIRRRFQYALAYIITACFVWCLFFAARQQNHWIAFVSGSGALFLICVIVLIFTFTPVYQNYTLHTSIIISLALCGFCMMSFIYDDPDLSAVGIFTGIIEIIVMMYTVIPLPLFLSIALGLKFSVILELFSGLRTNLNSLPFILGRIFLHLCIHVIGIHIFIMGQVRKRSTFLKVCQSVITRRDLQIEKQLKQKMIYSLMPAKVAEEIIKARDEEKGNQNDDDDIQGPGSQKRHSSTGKAHPEKGVIKFRTFHMDTASNVSILFADIVGFTKMSSNKTAEHLVYLLNDLFGRFDVLCEKCGCEKISTLGDCYYCVSGCPEPKADHAMCCVDMGLRMCTAIQEFDRDHKEEVNMRVGVHTGTVLCGLVGTRRFKFDVWSHDVTLANMMESEGKPGRVHISESTYHFVKDAYDVEGGDPVEDIRKHKVLIEYYNKEKQGYDIKHIQDEETIPTYFIVGLKSGYQSERETTKNPSSSDGVVITEVQEKNGKEGDVAFDGIAEKSHSSHANAEDDNVPATVLLNQRETLATSAENLHQKEETEESALMDQIHAQREIREKTDKQLVECMQEDGGVEDYLYRPPINRFTLNFLNSKYERSYRNNREKEDAIPTFAMPRYSSLFDLIVAIMFFALISTCIFITFPISIEWIIFFVLSFTLELIMVLPQLCDVCIIGSSSNTFHKVGVSFSGWLPRHIFGAIIISLPAAAVYCNFSCIMFSEIEGSDLFYCLVLVASLLHYCNFTMLSSWMKTILAIIAGIVLLVLLGIGICESESVGDAVLNATQHSALNYLINDVALHNNISVTLAPVDVNATHFAIFSGHHRLKYELILNMAILVLLILFLNREFEISYRLSFHGDAQAAQDSIKMQEEKDQADWLLHNIIPEHVSDILKKTSKYCKNHKEVGVIFAKISNYDDFYDETFEGGKEYLRVLNELMGDFEDLFDEQRFKDVEKIKTIGACLMAAAGLNEKSRSMNKDPNAHLYALMDFALEMLEKLKQFNAEIFNFDFELMIGFNFGEVTAGVIGTTKLLYDIWGDTVNISSRMYSTGQPGKIQVTEDTAKKLAPYFEFEYRGKTYVKGKGDMSTYLLVKKLDGPDWYDHEQK